MRRLSLLFAVQFIVPLLAFDSPKEYDGTMEAFGTIEGTWLLSEIEINGSMKKKPNFQCLMTFRNGTCTSRWGADGMSRESYRIDNSQKPNHLDLIASNGSSTIKQRIYQIDGDTLRVASVSDWSRTRRPQSFNEDGGYILTYKRVK